MKDRRFRHMTKATLEVHGWWVRLVDLRAKPAKKIVSKTFNINVYAGDVAKAERAARRRRSRMLKECGYPSEGTLVGAVRSVNASRPRKIKRGKDADLPVGVYRADKTLPNGNKVYGFAAFVAPTPMEVKTQRKNYDPNLPGDEERALRFIKRKRKEWEKTYYK